MNIAHALPIPSAGFGATACTLGALIGVENSEYFARRDEELHRPVYFAKTKRMSTIKRHSLAPQKAANTNQPIRH